jgi:hypothetical protein
MLVNYKLKLLITFLVMFGVAFVCSSSKDDKKEETKKEDTKKEDTKKEDDKKEDTKSSNEYIPGSKLYFVEEYRDGEEIGKSDVFTISPSGGYLTVMIDLRATGKKVGVGKLDLRISKKSGDGEKIVDTKSFDVQPDWDYIFFDKFYTFRSDGKYKVIALKPDGTPVAAGELTINYK